MATNAALKYEQYKLIHSIELFGYLTTRNLRKKYDIYDFENNFEDNLVSIENAYKSYKNLENELTDTKMLNKKNKIVQLK